MSPTDPDNLELRLQPCMARALGLAGPIGGVRRLTGGANMESWSFDCDGQGFVLRRAATAQIMVGRPYGHHVEVGLISAVRAHGVKAPEVVAELRPEDGLGSGYIMRRVEGEVDPKTILSSPPAHLLADLAIALAAIHSVPIDAVHGVPRQDPRGIVSGLQTQFDEYGADRPVLALALRWLTNNLPKPGEVTLVHGDFRMGNIMTDAHGLVAVLDWEMAHLGDPHDDLAYGCMTVWRFGHVAAEAYGLGSLEEFFVTYEAASGRRVDRTRFRFWLILRTVWWALGCIRMGRYWRSGADRSLERVVIGRRAAENELDLLLILEHDAPQIERDRVLPPAAHQQPVPAGEPSAAEIITAVAEWLAAEIKPQMTGRDKFQTAVALNALGIVRRELSRPNTFTVPELARTLECGEISLETPGVLARLRRLLLDKLENDMPKYPALRIARDRWSSAGS